MKKLQRKRKKPSKAKLIKRLDEEWSAYVRKRDVFCQKCGGNGHISAHHAFGRRHLSTRWDVFNGVGLCYPCHIHWAHRDPSGFSYWFRNHIGQDQYERLAEAHNTVQKFTTEELERQLSVLESMNKELYDRA